MFKVHVSEVKEIKLPELDDEFVRSIGQGVETLDALTENITSNLRVMSEEGARRRHEEKIIDTLSEISRVEFPPVLIEHEIDRLIAAHEPGGLPQVQGEEQGGVEGGVAAPGYQASYRISCTIQGY